MSIFDVEAHTSLTLIDDLIKEEYGNVHRVFQKIGLRFLDSGLIGCYGLRFRDTRGYYDWSMKLTWKDKGIPGYDPGQEDHMVFYDLNEKRHRHAVTTVQEVHNIMEAVRQERKALGWTEE